MLCQTARHLSLSSDHLTSAIHSWCGVLDQIGLDWVLADTVRGAIVRASRNILVDWASTARQWQPELRQIGVQVALLGDTPAVREYGVGVSSTLLGRAALAAAFPAGPGDSLVLIRLSRRIIGEPSPAPPAVNLTPRQWEIARLVAGGAGTEAIAESLAISPHTVRRHIEAVLQRVGVSSRLALGAKLRATAGSAA